MNPTKTIVDQAEAALRLFFAESREDASRLLEMYGPLVHMFEQDLDAAVEVRHLVLARFPSAEPPSVPGLDFLPGTQTDADVLGTNEPFCPACKHRMRMHSKDWGCNVWLRGKACPCVTGFAGFAPPKQTQADAATPAAEAVAVLDEPKAREYTDREGDLWVDGHHEHIVFLVRLRGKACEPVPYVRDDAEDQFGPLVEVPAPVKEQPDAKPRVWLDCEGDTWTEQSDGSYACDPRDGSGRCGQVSLASLRRMWGPLEEVTA